MTWEEGHTPDQLAVRQAFVAWAGSFHPRCTGLAYAGQPGHLLVRCKLPSGHPRSHEPSWDERESNS